MPLLIFVRVCDRERGWGVVGLVLALRGFGFGFELDQQSRHPLQRRFRGVLLYGICYGVVGLYFFLLILLKHVLLWVT